MSDAKVTGETITDVRCPKCNAPAGRPCQLLDTRVIGDTARPHRERAAAWNARHKEQP